MADKPNCTVLVSSCDAYSDAWPPFFSILKTEWPDCPYPIVLCTDGLPYHMEGLDIATYGLHPAGERVPWGQLLLEHLERINTEYVLFLLEDFYFEAPVDQKRIEQCLGWLEADENIAMFSFIPTDPRHNIRDGKYPSFEKRPKNPDAPYVFNTQAAVWRRRRLMEFIRPHENPWEWEVNGSRRACRYPDDFYSAVEGEPAIMWYPPGGVLYRGKWVEEYMAPLLEKHGIEMDLIQRGCKPDRLPTKPFWRKVVDSPKTIAAMAGRAWRRYLSLKR